MTRILWTEPAVADLAAIRDFVARDSEAYADALAEQIVDAVERLAHFPRSGRLVPEVKRPAIREVIASSFRVLYRARPGAVEILAVVHGARDVRRLRRKGWKR